MSKIEGLSENEIRYVCEKIGKNEIKKSFIQNPKWLKELKPGFRPTSLSTAEIVDLVTKHWQKPFLKEFLNDQITTWVEETENDISNQMSAGKNKDTALMIVLPKSIFGGSPELFFKYSSFDVDENVIELIVAGCSALDQCDSDESRIKANSLEHDEFMEIRSEWEKERTELQNSLEEYENEKNNILLELESARKQITEEQERNDSLNKELITLNKRVEKYIPKRISVTSGFPYTSLCIVEYDVKGYMRLKRLADIENDVINDIGKIELPEYRKPFRSEADEDDGTIAIWDWKVSPNINDPSKPYFDSEKSSIYEPIEVILTNVCKTLSDLKSLLVAGIKQETVLRRQLWCIKGSNTQTEGIYCTESDYSISNGEYKLNDDVTEVPVYDVSISSILTIDDTENTKIYRFLDIGFPKRFEFTKDPMDIVRSKFLSRITRQGMKTEGYTISDYQNLKACITKLNTSNLVEEVSLSCNCDNSEAEAMVEGFIDRAGEYLTGKDFDSEVLCRILATNPDLLESVKDRIDKEWSKENSERIAKAESEIERINTEKNAAIKEKERYEEEYNSTRIQIEQAEKILEKQKELAKEVEAEVNSRITKAKANAAEFIAEMAFAQSVPTANNTVSVQEGFSYTCGYSTEEEVEECSTREELLEVLRSELMENGVSSLYAYAFGAILYSAFLHRIPIVLCGANAIEIAESLSVSIFGRKPGHLVLENGYNKKSYESAIKSDDPIIIVENFFNPLCNPYMLRSAGNKYCIGVETYAENIMIEPLGVLDHVIPIFTGTVVDDNVSGYHVYGKCNSDLILRSSLKRTKPNKLIRSLGLNPLACNRYSNMIEDMHCFIKDANYNNEILMLILPVLSIRKSSIDVELILNEYLDNGYITEKELYQIKTSIGI